MIVWGILLELSIGNRHDLEVIFAFVESFIYNNMKVVNMHGNVS